MKVHHYYCLTAIVIALVCSWLFRFTVVPLGGEGGASAYLLDRWSGDVRWFHWSEVHQMKPYSR